MTKEQAYIPDRRDVVWLDFDPQKGKEVGKYRPALILSSKAYAKQNKPDWLFVVQSAPALEVLLLKFLFQGWISPLWWHHPLCKRCHGGSGRLNSF